MYLSHRQASLVSELNISSFSAIEATEPHPPKGMLTPETAAPPPSGGDGSRRGTQSAQLGKIGYIDGALKPTQPTVKKTKQHNVETGYTPLVL